MSYQIVENGTRKTISGLPNPQSATEVAYGDTTVDATLTELNQNITNFKWRKIIDTPAPSVTATTTFTLSELIPNIEKIDEICVVVKFVFVNGQIGQMVAYKSETVPASICFDDTLPKTIQVFYSHDPMSNNNTIGSSASFVKSANKISVTEVISTKGLQHLGTMVFVR